MGIVKRWLSGVMSGGTEGTNAGGSRRKARTPQRLMEQAEHAPELRAPQMVEQLENRQYLFQIVIPQDVNDPLFLDQNVLPVIRNGVLTGVDLFFAYMNPFRRVDIPPPVVPAEVTTTDFTNTEAQGFLPDPATGVITIDDRYSAILVNATLDIIDLPIVPPATEAESRLQLAMGPGESVAVFFTPGPAASDDDPRIYEFQAYVQWSMAWEQIANFAPGDFRVELLQIPYFQTIAFLQDPTTNDPAIVTVNDAFDVPAINGPIQGDFVANPANGPEFFNAIRFVLDAGGGANTANLRFTDWQSREQVSRFGELHDDRIGAVRLRVEAPAGSVIEVLDLYGRQMILTQALSTTPGNDAAQVDLDDDGIPNFNDGIGRISITGTNAGSRVLLAGGVTGIDTEDLDGDTFFGDFIFSGEGGFLGRFDDFEEGGFGYAIDPDGNTVGLPAGLGSVIIGAPWTRDNRTPADYYGPPIFRGPSAPISGFENFSNTPLANNLAGLPGIPVIKQGVTIDNNIGELFLHAAVHGVVDITGSVNTAFVGFLPGSLNITGDARAVMIGSDTGTWINTEWIGTATDAAVSTGSSITIGRTLGQLNVGGRNAANVLVLSDINNAARPPVQFLNYAELETFPGLTEGQFPEDIEPEVFLLQGNQTAVGLIFDAGGLLLGAGYFRNDSILSAEYVGAGLRGAIISGSIGAFNPISQTEDSTDFYAFGAGRGDRINFDVQAPTVTGSYARVVDSNGRVVAAVQFPPLAPNTNQTNAGTPRVRMRFTADRTDTYYLVIGGQPDGDPNSSQGYVVTMAGQAAVAAGAFTSGGTWLNSTITVRNGSVGLVRAGVGITSVEGGGSPIGGGTIGDPPGLGTDSQEDQVDFLRVAGGTLTVSNGSLFALLAGSDIRAMAVNIGGDLGGLAAGQFFRADIAGNVGAGDITGLVLRVGGSVGAIVAPLGLGFQNTDTGQVDPGAAGAVQITTGQGGGPGHIGAILVGNTFVGNNFTLTTSADSIIDRFLVGTAGAGTIGQFQPNLQLGPRSDIRFANFDSAVVGSLGSSPDTNLFRDVVYGQTLRLTDDNGTPFTVRIGGGINNTATPNASRMRVRFLPVNGSQGVVLARIEVALVNGADLFISGEAAGRVSIGQIRYATDGGTAVARPDLSSISISGPAEIDVLSIITDAGVGAALNVTGAGNGPLGSIRNQTTRGDLVAVDILALGPSGNISVAGNLGLTETSGVGDRLIGPWLGIGGALGPGVGAAPGFFVDSTTLGEGTFVGLYQIDGAVVNTTEDFGAPFDGWLNGVIIRTGNTVAGVGANQNVTIRADGAIGDVMTQDPAVVLSNVVANADNTRVVGAFDGIVGTIYANTIGTVDVGDGLLSPGDSPFATAGIFAGDTIARVVAGTRVRNPVINGVISAAGNSGAGTQAIGQITITNAVVDGAFIGASTHDSWWRSARAIPNAGLVPADPITGTAVVNRLVLTGTNLRRSTVVGVNVNQVNITRGVFDASTVQAQVVAEVDSGNIQLIRADGFVNTTRDGEALEYRIALIRAAGDVGTIQTNTRGSISDLFVDINGNITRSITALNMTRLSLDVDATINAITAQGDFRSINVTAGRLLSARAVNVRSSTFTVAGEVRSVSATNSITSSVIEADGPFGTIGTIVAGNSISGQIISSGVVRGITATRGDISALIRTTEPDADLLSIRAGRDAAISLDALGNVGSIIAGRHVGRRAVLGSPADQLQVRGNLATITAGGQVYADVKVGQSITGQITAGRVAALPNTVSVPTRDRVSAANIVAYGRINAVTITGDFAGRIESYSGGIGKVTINAGSLRRYAPDVTTVTPEVTRGGIFAHDGNIDSVSITRGHLLGDVIATNGSIGTISIKGDANFGDIGIDPTKVVDPNTPTAADTALAASEGRFRLPALPTGSTGAGRDGPTIQARYDIGTISTTGRLFEAAIIAGRTIRQISALGADDVGGASLTPSFILAGDLVTTVNFTGNVDGLLIGGGIVNLGADGLPGGIGADTDTVESGDVGAVTIRGSANNLRVTAGMNAGADGLYNNADDLAAIGLSTVRQVTVTGAATNSSVFADTSTGVVSPAGISTGGTDLATVAPVFVVAGLPPGTLIPAAGQVFNVNGNDVNIRLSGPGQAFFDTITVPGTARILLIGTTSSSQLQFTQVGSANTLSNLVILSTDDSSLSSIVLPHTLTGATSGMYVDGTVGNASFGNISTVPGAPGEFQVGQGVNSLVLGGAGNLAPNIVRFTTQFLGNATINGGLGDSQAAGAISNQSRLDAKTATAIQVNGALGGIISVDQDASRLTITGAVDEGGVRVGGATQTFSAASLFRARLSFRSGVTNLNINGNTDESLVYAGTDLGEDARVGGTNANADTTGNGNISRAVFGGDFTRSDLAAGVRRGASGFLTTSTDIAAPGRSVITSVVINGTQVGSPVNSQQYGIVTNGSVGGITIGGAGFTGGAGNFQSINYDSQPELLRVVDLRVGELGGVFTARMTFSQALNFSSVSSALIINEVRGTAGQLAESAALVEGTDYFLSYDADTFVLSIEFSTTITDRRMTADVPGLDTPQVDGFGDPLPSPGIYRFVLLADELGGQDTGQILDGNGDGATGDDYEDYTIVGDAGDRLDNFTANTTEANIPLYGPSNLDVLMGGALTGLNTLNTTFTIRGKIGDNPYHDTSVFPPTLDFDIYTFSLRAGQILRFGGLTGVAALAEFRFFRVSPTGGVPVPAGDGFQTLSTDQPVDPNQGPAFSWLIERSGTYAIAISTGNQLASAQADGFYDPFPPAGPTPNTFLFAPNANGDIPITVADIERRPLAGGNVTGDYSFGIRIADDGDSGFAAEADPNDGSPLFVPLPSDFATPTTVLTVADAGGGADFTFRLRVGADGLAGTSDDLVIGNNGRGINSTREAGLDGLFNTGDDRVLLTNDAGDGLDAVSAPLPSEFAGPDGNLGTFDDLLVINRDGYQFILNPGANGVINGNTGSDDRVIGTDVYGNTLTRAAGKDNAFGTLDDLTTVGASIGDRGVPGYTPTLQGDVDIINLNSDTRIAVNSRMRVTLRSVEDGSNLGLLEPTRNGFQGAIDVSDLRGLVQFAIFETSAKSTISDGRVIAAPDRINYLDGAPNLTLSNDGFTRYGFDEKGDFYIEFTVPGRLDDATVPASLALYVQGALQTDYQVEIQNLGVGAAPPVLKTQNILLETNGGTVDWLEASRRTVLEAYNALNNGFSSRFNGVPAADYILNSAANPNNLVNQVQALFDGALGAGRVRISTNPADFEGETFSTIYITSSPEPAPFFSKGNFGEVERVDPFNSNPADEGVVYANALNLLGFTPTQGSADAFIRSLAAAVTRQAVQLMGVRTTVAVGLPFPVVEVTADDSPSQNAIANAYGFTDALVNLGGQGSVNSNTQFFLGQQNSFDLLRRIFGVA